MVGEQRSVSELALLEEEVVSVQCQKKQNGIRYAARTTEVAVLKINEAGGIREIYQIIGEIPETEKEKEAGRRKEVGGGSTGDF